MEPRKAGIATAVIVITIGVAWLLNSVGVFPAVEWVWTLGLAIIGVFVITLLGWDKVTAVIGPFLIVSSVFSILRQTGRITLNYEIPLLVIIFGILLLVAVLAPLPRPNWLLGGGQNKS